MDKALCCSPGFMLKQINCRVLTLHTTIQLQDLIATQSLAYMQRIEHSVHACIQSHITCCSPWSSLLAHHAVHHNERFAGQVGVYQVVNCSIIRKLVAVQVDGALDVATSKILQVCLQHTRSSTAWRVGEGGRGRYCWLGSCDFYAE